MDATHPYAVEVSKNLRRAAESTGTRLLRCLRPESAGESCLFAEDARAAAGMLEKEGIHVQVVDMFSIKPLDEELIVRCAQETGAIISAEEHNIYGGLGGAVAEALCKAGAQVPMGFVGINDCHAECGPYAKLQAKYGLDANAIAAKVRETIAKKK